MSKTGDRPSFDGMGIAEDIVEDWQAALAALAWQVDLGVCDGVGDTPVDRYELAEMPRPTSPQPQPQPKPPAIAFADAAAGGGAVQAAQLAAQAAASLTALRAAMVGFAHCDLRQGARNLVFSDGVAGARVMVLGPAPGREEDQDGRVFAGAAGALFDKMFAAIGLSRSGTLAADGVYACPVLPWRPPSDRVPEAAEIAMMRPFVVRHIALAAPDCVVAMGNSACAMLFGVAGEAEIAVGRVRGSWREGSGMQVLPMFDPAHLLRNPAAKREAWADLLTLQARLQGQA